MNGKPRWWLSLGLISLLIVVFAFSGIAVAQDKYESGTLTIAMGAEPRSLMPNTTRGTWAGAIGGQLFDAMVAGDNEIVGMNKPGVAKSWEIDREDLIITFHLREGVEFHDGHELTSEDVLFSFKCWMHPDYPGVRFSNFQNIVGARDFRDGKTEWPIDGIWAPDDYTVKIQLTQVQATFLSYAAGSGIMPKHVYEPYFEENGYGELQGATLALDKLVGSGPFKFEQWKPGQYIEISANEDYWGAEVTEEESWIPPVPQMKEVFFVIIPDTQAQFQALQAGDIDATGLTTDQYWQADKMDSIKAWRYPYLVYDYLSFNLDPEKIDLFQNQNVRKAISWAIDREELIDKVMEGLGTVCSGPSHELRWDWDLDIKEAHPGFDVNKTIQLMEEAGWTIEKDEDGNIASGAVWKKDGKKMEFEIATNYPNPRRQDFAQIIQGQLYEAGFHTTLRILDTNAFYYDYLMGNFEFETAIAGWRMGSDPDPTSIFHSDSYPKQFNWMKYSNPNVDELIEEGLQYFDQEKRKPIYQHLNKLLVQDHPYVWLAYQDGTFGSNPRLKGFKPVHPQGWWINLAWWYWGEEA